MDKLQTIFALGILANLSILTKKVGSKITLAQGMEIASEVMPQSFMIGSDASTSQTEKEDLIIKVMEEVYKEKFL